jgi:hypothetical protein
MSAKFDKSNASLQLASTRGFADGILAKLIDWPTLAFAEVVERFRSEVSQLEAAATLRSLFFGAGSCGYLSRSLFFGAGSCG